MAHPATDTLRSKPLIAIVEANTLTAIGLQQLIERVMPAAEVCLFTTAAALLDGNADRFFHYFVSPKALLDAPTFFRAHSHRTIVLAAGAECGWLPQEFHRLDTALPEPELVRAFLRMAQQAHGQGQHIPKNVRRQIVQQCIPAALTPREVEVLKGIVRGLINKEIAEWLHISLTTVISHRKNLIEKTGIRSVSGLTIYAVTHGILPIEEI